MEQKPGANTHNGADACFPDISKTLPQKYPFLFIDKILEADKNRQAIKCLKNFTANEYFFQGHFPDNPIVPGVIIIEAMAQASILLYALVKPHNMPNRPQFFLGKVEAKFKKSVTGGDSIIIDAVSEKIIDTGGIVKSQAAVNGELVAEATISFGVKLAHSG
jgi:3-hydroxyacyl-[acyl-carrier-protein] dehydratase